MPLLGKFVLEIAATLITLGGLYDLFAPRLPANLVPMCNGNPQACKLVRELLRALGGALVSIGLAAAVLISGFDLKDRRRTLILILVLVLPSEGINSVCMHRVGSPFLIPMAFAALTLVGVILAWPWMAH
jgi:hypothetical protein